MGILSCVETITSVCSIVVRPGGLCHPGNWTVRRTRLGSPSSCPSRTDGFDWITNTRSRGGGAGANGRTPEKKERRPHSIKKNGLGFYF